MTTPKPTILLTGANGGLGIGYVQNLLKSPFALTHHALYTVRTPSTVSTLTALLAKSAPKNHSYTILPLDFNSLANVRKVGSEINAKIEKGELGLIQALTLNAGWQEANKNTLKPQSFTEEGYESHFGINYLAQFLFTLLLLQSMDKERGRVVMVSSFSHNTEDLRAAKDMKLYLEEQYKELYREKEGGAKEWAKGREYEDDGYLAGMRRYGGSKLGGVMFMYELQRRLDSDPVLSKISILSLDPGGMGGTNLLRASPPYIRFLLTLLAYVQGVLVYFNPNGTWRTPYKSGTDLLLACFETKYLGEHPKALYLDGSLKAESSGESRDDKKQGRLWGESLELAVVGEGDTTLVNWK